MFTHLKLWIASARHNFKWVKIQIKYHNTDVDYITLMKTDVDYISYSVFY